MNEAEMGMFKPSNHQNLNNAQKDMQNILKDLRASCVKGDHHISCHPTCSQIQGKSSVKHNNQVKQRFDQSGCSNFNFSTLFSFEYF